MIDAAWRAALAVAYPVLRLWWFVRRPTIHGAHVIVRRRRELEWQWLLVGNSYKSDLTVPCGGLRAGERPLDAAVRELREETGLCVPRERLSPLAEVVVRYHGREDHAHYFELTLQDDEDPVIRIDRREVVWAEFVPVRELGQLPIVPHLRELLARQTRVQPPSSR